MGGAGTPVPGGTAFQLGFHVVVGLAMALFHGGLLKPRLPGPRWWQGLLCAVAVWLVNAFIVLPGGVRGSRAA